MVSRFDTMVKGPTVMFTDSIIGARIRGNMMYAALTTVGNVINDELAKAIIVMSDNELGYQSNWHLASLIKGNCAVSCFIPIDGISYDLIPEFCDTIRKVFSDSKLLVAWYSESEAHRLASNKAREIGDITLKKEDLDDMFSVMKTLRTAYEIDKKKIN